MTQLMYTMQFKGYAAPVGASPHVLQVITIGLKLYHHHGHWGRGRARHAAADRGWQGGL